MRKQAEIKTRRKNASALHRKVLGLLREAFPAMRIFEDQSVEVNGRKLFVDLFIRDLGVCIECHGRQHDEFVPHFHGTRVEFQRSQERDRAKKQALVDAGYAFLEVREKEAKNLTATDLANLVTQAIKDSAT